ncbi:MAG: hypothetical protein K2V71_08900 [Methylotenera sp.]|nr:hypothetical protein [Methylotenera sp.]
MADNLNYYWQKRNEQEKRVRDYDQLQSDIENGLRHNATKAKIKALEDEVEYYKNLLTKPMIEIAALNNDFEETYHEQQTIIGEWMVSQRAFKELAIKLGIETGRTKEEVIQEGLANDVKVLNNQTEHGNDFNQSEFQLYYAPRIKAKLGIK